MLLSVYNYFATNHRLNGISANGSSTLLVYDASGNLNHDTGKNYTYNNIGRLQNYQNYSISNIAYVTGLNGQRTQKIDNI